MTVETRHRDLRRRARRVEPALRHRVERGDRDDALARGEREPLNRRDAHPKSRERTGAGHDGEIIDVRERAALGREPRRHLVGKPLAVGALGLAGHRGDVAVDPQRETAAPRRRLERQDDHRGNVILRRCSILLRRAKSLPLQPRCLPCLRQSTRPRRRCASTSTPSASIVTRSSSSGWAISTRCSTRTR